MSHDSPSSAKPIELDEFVALNDEIAALIRAGVPLELGLRGFAGTVSGNLSRISQRLAGRIEQGESLQAALSQEGSALPQVYRLVVQSGLDAGRVTQAFAAVSDYAQMLQEVRRRIAISLIYPAIVILLAWYLFWGVLIFVIPELVVLPLEPGEAPSGAMQFYTTLADSLLWWGHVPPILFVLAIGWWLISTRRSAGGTGIANSGLRYFPGLRTPLKQFDLANFAGLGSLLLEHQVPAATAFRLAAEATGNATLSSQINRACDAHERGEPLATGINSVTYFPPLIRWMIGTGEKQGALIPIMRQIAVMFREKAQLRIDRFSILFPVLITVFLAGGAVLFYALGIFYPFTQMMHSLSLDG